MQVRLRVLQGSNTGKEIKVPVSEFVIGRKEGCHLRPRSDLISRKHCVLVISENSVVVRDLNSRNGTYINGEKIDGEVELRGGECLKVGKIELEVVIDLGLGGTKKPVVKDVKDAAVRTAATVGAENPNDDGDVGNWLEEADVANRQSVDPDTRQYKLDESERKKVEETPNSEETINSANPDAADDTQVINKKKKPGKLPKQESQSENSRDAAAEALKSFFNRR